MDDDGALDLHQRNVAEAGLCFLTGSMRVDAKLQMPAEIEVFFELAFAIDASEHEQKKDFA